MNDEKKLECGFSSSRSEPECGFSVRLKELIGGEGASAFARQCGISDSLMRKYLAGSTPGIDKAARIAEVGGVSLDWLVLGKEPNAQRGAGSGEKRAQSLDIRALEDVSTLLRAAEDDLGVRLSGIALARVTRMLYGWLTDNALSVTPELVRDVVTAQVGSDKWKK